MAERIDWDAMLSKVKLEDDAEERKELTDVDVQVVLTFADNNMNATETGKKLFMYRTTVKYHLERVERKTGLNPLKFYDLVELVGVLKETEGR